jgi:hypothetical protein
MKLNIYDELQEKHPIVAYKQMYSGGITPT